MREFCEIVIAGMHFITRIRKVYGESGGFKLCCAVNGFGAFSSRTIFAHVEPSSEKKLSGRNSPFSWRVKLLENFEF